MTRLARRSRALITTTVVLAATALALFALPVRAAQDIPIGMYNVNNQVMNSGQYAYAIRFVPHTDETIYRFFSGFNLEGSDFLGGRDGYAQGTGGTIRARLVTVAADGTPNLGNVLAQEDVAVAQRYAEATSAFGISGINQLLYFNMGGVALKAGTLYAMVYTNVAGDPSSDWFSENSPTVAESVAGPNGRNTLDEDAAGAIAGLDPREAVAWSTDGGKGWLWGRLVGQGDTQGAYVGDATGDDGTRLPWYGVQTSAGAKPQSGQPYYAYTDQGTYTLRAAGAPRAVTLTEAGGYGPADSAVGTVTVHNVTTGESAHTEELGGGLAKGSLDHPLAVNQGDTYEVSNTGTVYKQQADSFIEAVFGVGAGRWPFSTEGNGNDVAELFALPHPWFTPIVVTAAAAAAPAPLPPLVSPGGRGGGASAASAPLVAINFPHTSSKFRRTLRISVRASSAGGIDRVRFYLDGKRIGVDRRAPFKTVFRIGKHRRLLRGHRTVMKLRGGADHVLIAKAVAKGHRVGISPRIVIKRNKPIHYRRKHNH